MKNLRYSIFLIIIPINAFQHIYAQNVEIDPAEIESKYALFQDAYRNKQYYEAKESLEWLFLHAPDRNEGMYIKGSKIYSELAKQSNDPIKTEYKLKSLETYDQRIRIFGKEAETINHKAFQAYKLFKDDPTYSEEVIRNINEAYELNGDSIFAENLASYMDLMRRSQNDSNKFSYDSIHHIYLRINQTLQFQIEHLSNSEKTRKLKEVTDGIYFSMVPDGDCDFIKKYMNELWEIDSLNKSLSRKIMTICLSSKCTELPLFMKAVSKIQDEKPTYHIALIMASKYDLEKQYDQAFEMYEQARQLASTENQLFDAYMALAGYFQRIGDFPQARKSALNASDINKKSIAPYQFIGDLYMESLVVCQEKKNEIYDRLLFIAAFEMYKLANNQKYMQLMEEQFPSSEKLFFNHLAPGDSMKLGCWVNEEITLKARP